MDDPSQLLKDTDNGGNSSPVMTPIAAAVVATQETTSQQSPPVAISGSSSTPAAAVTPSRAPSFFEKDTDRRIKKLDEDVINRIAAGEVRDYPFISQTDRYFSTVWGHFSSLFLRVPGLAAPR